MEFRNYYCGFLFVGISISFMGSIKSSNFSEKYFGVYFNPVVSRHDRYLDTRRQLNDAYNETEIISMLNLISTRFRRIMMRSIEQEDLVMMPGFSSAKIPSAVATLNKQKTTGEAIFIMELIMQFHILEGVAPLQTSFDFVKGEADKANRISPGTVVHLMLDLSNNYRMLTSKIGNISEHLAGCKSKLAGSPYKLGAVLPKDFCKAGRTQTWNVFVQLATHNIQSVMFIFPTFKAAFKKGVTPKTLQSVFGFFEGCKSTLSQQFPNLEVMYKSGWPGTSTNVKTISNLVHFWELINAWAVRTSTPVVLHEAFDNKVADGVNHSSSGWWKLVESSGYESALDYVFEEKKFGSSHTEGNNGSMTDTTWLADCFPNTTGNGSNFNLPNLGVAFNPYLSHRNGTVSFNNYKESDFYPLLQLASTEFSTILVEVIPPYDTDYHTLQVPIAVANMNKLGMLFPRPHPLQVALVFRCEACIKRDLDESFLETEFDAMKAVADKANSIFPSSVPTLLMKYDKLKAGTKKYVLKYLELSRRKLIITDSSDLERQSNKQAVYRLGALLPLQDCDSSRSNLNPHLISILDQLDLVIFDFALDVFDYRSLPSTEDLNLDVEQSLGGYFRWFKFCTAKIRRHHQNKGLEVGYMVTWPDTNDKGVRHVGKLVEFWGKIRKWAEATNTTVFMRAAFDTQFQGNPVLSTRGWWRLLENSSQGNTSDYVFEDKKTVFLRELAELQLDHQSANYSQRSIIVNNLGGMSGTSLAFVVVAAIVLVGLVGIGAGIAYTIKYGKGNNSEVVLLTKEEINDFFNGEGTFLSDLFSLSGAGNAAGYNQDLECSKEEFEIDENKILGRGEFGIVYLAKLRKGGGENNPELDVAAKTVKSSSHSSTALKGMLSEIRILGYLGSHENIVSIVGAHTAELQLGKVFLFTELCTLGSLKDVLRTIQPTPAGSSLNNTTEYYFAEESGKDCDDDVDYLDHNTFEMSEMQLAHAEILELVKWAYQISCGMEFLASKHVIHADLGARNVLLTKEKIAKISDFGLSRRMYDYQSYVKKHKEPLPWRTMAPESLRHLEFNEKTDVWAFGVTLWEIFSLGEVPYAGLMWSADFVSILENGLRLTQPRYDSKNMFPIMSKCWSLDKSQRPKFSDLKTVLESRLAGCTQNVVVDDDDEEEDRSSL